MKMKFFLSHHEILIVPILVYVLSKLKNSKK